MDDHFHPSLNVLISIKMLFLSLNTFIIKTLQNFITPRKIDQGEWESKPSNTLKTRQKGPLRVNGLIWR